MHADSVKMILVSDDDNDPLSNPSNLMLKEITYPYSIKEKLNAKKNFYNKAVEISFRLPEKTQQDNFDFHIFEIMCAFINIKEGD